MCALGIRQFFVENKRYSPQHLLVYTMFCFIGLMNQQSVPSSNHIFLNVVLLSHNAIVGVNETLHREIATMLSQAYKSVDCFSNLLFY